MRETMRRPHGASADARAIPARGTGPLGREIRESLSLIALTAASAATCLGLGLLALHLLG